MEKAEVIRGKSGPVITHMIDLTCKDMRSLRFGFASQDMCKRAHSCLDLYVFPNKEDYLFAFNYRVDRPFPPEIDGWKIVRVPLFAASHIIRPHDHLLIHTPCSCGNMIK
jgi:hypothetical protein